MLSTKRRASVTRKNDSRFPKSEVRNFNGDLINFFLHFPAEVIAIERRKTEHADNGMTHRSDAFVCSKDIKYTTSCIVVYTLLLSYNYISCIPLTMGSMQR